MTLEAPAATDGSAGPSQCWCCDSCDDPTLMIHLGNHPEVALCRPCARWAAKQAWEIDDRSKTGPSTVLRDRLRDVRRTVVDHGWHRNRVVGAALRRLGNHLP